MFKVVVDTREKTPWKLASSFIYDTEIRTLATGDYTISGMEDLLCIERKKSLSEFIGNMTEDRFKRELNRMKKFDYAYLIMEFDYDDVKMFPLGSNIPQNAWKQIKVKSPFIMKYISEVQVCYGIQVILAGNTANAEHIATNIMKRVYELHGEDKERNPADSG